MSLAGATTDIAPAVVATLMCRAGIRVAGAITGIAPGVWPRGGGAMA